jgi:phage shock protein A
MTAVSAGDDALAKKALSERQRSLAEIERIRRDRDEAASYAIELNNSRKTADNKLRMLKLRKGTLATQLKAARTGSTSPLGVDSELFDKFAEAEQAIDEDAIEAEVMAAMEGEEVAGGGLSAAEFDQKLRAAGADPAVSDDDPLAALKAKMAAHEAAKKANE